MSIKLKETKGGENSWYVPDYAPPKVPMLGMIRRDFTCRGEPVAMAWEDGNNPGMPALALYFDRDDDERKLVLQVCPSGKMDADSVVIVDAFAAARVIFEAVQRGELPKHTLQTHSTEPYLPEAGEPEEA